MPDIRVVDLCKSYRVAVKGTGIGGALRHLVRREHRDVRMGDTARPRRR